MVWNAYKTGVMLLHKSYGRIRSGVVDANMCWEEYN